MSFVGSKKAVVAAAVCLLLGAGRLARAETVSFNYLTQNDTKAPYDWQSNSQYRTDVTGNADGTVSFTFYNEGLVQSSITDIYFDDYDPNPVLKFSSTTTPKSPWVIGSTGVKFTVDADSKVAPGDLPGGNLADPDFVMTSGMSADADNPIYSNGVNNWTGTGTAEWVRMTFALTGTNTFDDVVTALQTGNSHLRIGIKVQGFVGGGSESFISNPLPPDSPPPPPTPVPLPAAAWGGMALCGMIGIGKLRRRSGPAQ